MNSNYDIIIDSLFYAKEHTSISLSRVQDRIDALSKQMKKMLDVKEQLEGVTELIESSIEGLGTFDAKEIVFCKDCKHRKGLQGQPNIMCCNMKDDDFCSYGERE